MIDSIGSCSSIAQEPAGEKVSVARRLSDKTVRFMIGEGNAKFWMLLMPWMPWPPKYVRTRILSS